MTVIPGNRTEPYTCPFGFFLRPPTARAKLSHRVLFALSHLPYSTRQNTEVLDLLAVTKQTLDPFKNTNAELKQELNLQTQLIAKTWNPNTTVGTVRLADQAELPWGTVDILDFRWLVTTNADPAYVKDFRQYLESGAGDVASWRNSDSGFQKRLFDTLETQIKTRLRTQTPYNQTLRPVLDKIFDGLSQYDPLPRFAEQEQREQDLALNQNESDLNLWVNSWFDENVASLLKEPPVGFSDYIADCWKELAQTAGQERKILALLGAARGPLDRSVVAKILGGTSFDPATISPAVKRWFSATDQIVDFSHPRLREAFRTDSGFKTLADDFEPQIVEAYLEQLDLFERDKGFNPETAHPGYIGEHLLDHILEENQVKDKREKLIRFAGSADWVTLAYRSRGLRWLSNLSQRTQKNPDLRAVLADWPDMMNAASPSLAAGARPLVAWANHTGICDLSNSARQRLDNIGTPWLRLVGPRDLPRDNYRTVHTIISEPPPMQPEAGSILSTTGKAQTQFYRLHDAGSQEIGSVNLFLHIAKRVFTGTEDGLFVFDDAGKQIPDAGSINIGPIRALCQVGESVFVGTNDGLFLFDHSGNQIPGAGSTSVGWVTRFLPVGNRVFVASEKGLFLFEIEGIQIPDAGSTGIGWALPMLHVGAKVFVGTDQGLFVFDEQGALISSVSSDGSGWVFQLLQVGEKVFAGTSLGLFVFTGDGKQISDVGSDEIESINIMLQVEDRIFVGTDEGLFLFDEAGRQISDAGSVDIMSVYALLHVGDRVFAGTTRGLFVFNKNGHLESSVRSEEIGSVPVLLYIEDKVIVGASLGLFAFDHATRQISDVGSEEITLVNTLLHVETNIFVGTEDGLFVFKQQENQASDAESTQIKPIKALLNNGKETVARTDDGSIVYDENGNELPGETSIPVASVSNLFSALARFLKTNKETSPADQQLDTGSQIGWVNTLLEVGNRVFVGTESGLFVFDDEGNRTHDAGSTRIASVQTLLQVGERVFVGTSTGLFVFDERGQLCSDATSTKLGYVNSLLHVKGRVFVGADEGLFVFDEVGLRHLKTAATHIESVKLLLHVGDRVFVGTRGGVFLFDETGQQLADAGSTKTEWLTTLLQVGERVFAGTHHGLFVFDEAGRHLSGYGCKQIEWVNSLLHVGDRVFVGTDEGLFVLDETGNQVSDPETTKIESVRALLHVGNRVLVANEDQILFLDESGRHLPHVQSVKFAEVEKLSALFNEVLVTVVGGEFACTSPPPASEFLVDAFKWRTKLLALSNGTFFVASPRRQGVYEIANAQPSNSNFPHVRG